MYRLNVEFSKSLDLIEERGNVARAQSAVKIVISPAEKSYNQVSALASTHNE